MRREEEFTVGDLARIEVFVPAGNIAVRAASDDSAVVRVSIDASNTELFDVYQVGDTVTIREDSSWRSRNRNVRVVVEAPAGCHVRTDTGSANVETRGPVGVVECQSGSGGVDVDHAERLDASSASGRIRVGTVTGDVRCETASGDVTVRSSEGQLAASTASGDVDASFAGELWLAKCRSEPPRATSSSTSAPAT